MRYFARTLRGLEELSWNDIREHGHSKLISLSHRTIEFESEADTVELLSLRSIEDLFLHVAAFEGLGHERASLDKLKQQLRGTSLAAALKLIEKIRPIPARASYSITASFVGSRNFNRWELADAIRAGLAELTDLSYVETRDQSAAPHDLNLRLLIEGQRGLLGIRVSEVPLHKRAYQVHHVPGSLSPVAAYMMVKLAALRSGEVLLDPLCGSGVIPIEASYFAPDAVVMGMEFDDVVAGFARENAAAARTGAAIAQGDIFRSSLEGDSVDVIVSDLPWGGQTALVGGTCQSLVAACGRLLKATGRMVLMSGDGPALLSALETEGFHLAKTLALSLHGKHPLIAVATREATNAGKSGGQ